MNSIKNNPNKSKKAIPYFIEKRGCINCEASKNSQEKHGKPYVFDHELMVSCVLHECIKYYSISAPFIDPEEVMNRAKQSGNEEYINNAKKYCLRIKKRFGKFYSQIGVSLDKIME